MGLHAHRLCAIGVHVQEASPRIGKDCGSMIPGGIPKEQGHSDGHDCGLYPMANLFRAAGEVSRLSPRGGGMSRSLVSTKPRILIRKRGVERLREAGRLNPFALGGVDDGRGRGSQKRVARPGYLDGKQWQTRSIDSLVVFAGAQKVVSLHQWRITL